MPKFSNPYQPIKKGFQSGCSICNASTDYKNIVGGGSMPKQASSSANLVNNGYNCSKKATDVIDPVGYNFNEKKIMDLYTIHQEELKRKRSLLKRKNQLLKN